MIKTIVTTAALFAFGLSAAQAQIFTDRDAFLAAITGAVTEDFEENGPGGFTGYGTTYVGGTFTVESTSLFTVDPDFDPFYVWNSGDVLDFEFGTGTITVAAGLNAIGFDFGNPELALGAGFVTINGVDYTLIGQPTFNFFGLISADPIVSINFNGGLGVIDNLTTGIGDGGPVIPEPATWALMIAGFGLVGGAMRRRVASVAA